MSRRYGIEELEPIEQRDRAERERALEQASAIQVLQRAREIALDLWMEGRLDLKTAGRAMIALALAQDAIEHPLATSRSWDDGVLLLHSLSQRVRQEQDRDF